MGDTIDPLRRLAGGYSISRAEMLALVQAGLVCYECRVWGLDAPNMGSCETLSLTPAGRAALDGEGKADG